MLVNAVGLSRRVMGHCTTVWNCYNEQTVQATFESIERRIRNIMHGWWADRREPAQPPLKNLYIRLCLCQTYKPVIRKAPRKKVNEPKLPDEAPRGGKEEKSRIAWWLHKEQQPCQQRIEWPSWWQAERHKLLALRFTTMNKWRWINLDLYEQRDVLAVLLQ